MCRILIVQKHVCLDTLGTNEELDCPLTTGLRVLIVIWFIFFTYFCDWPVKTELIYRSNCAKNNCNRFLIGTVVDRQFSTAFAFGHSSGQLTRDSKDWMSAFCECHHHLFRHFVPFTLWTIFIDRIQLFLWSRSEEWSLSCSESFCK